MRTPREQRIFDARRLHNLLLFAEHPETPADWIESIKGVCRALRRHLVEFYHLEGRQ